jgi:hypothetical protein
VVLEVDTRSRASASSKLALLVDQDWGRREKGFDARVWEFFAVAKAVRSEEQAIWLRIGRLFLWGKSQDVQQAGYPNWTAFVAEHSPWCESHTNAYVRLVESELDLVKEAVENNDIDITVATRAVKALGLVASREAQMQWLREATFEERPDRHRASMDVVSGDDMRRVLKARRLAAILRGGDAPTPVLDDFLVECHTQGLTSDQIVERARATPPKPDRLGKPVPDWTTGPTISLLGPWVEPGDIHDAVARIRATAALLEQRKALLGMAYHLIKHHDLWRSIPECDSLEEFCVVHLEVSQRTLQRHARVGLHLFQRPELRTEFEEGELTLDRAVFVAERAGSRQADLEGWIDLVKRLGRVELQQARERDGNQRDAYAPARAMAKAVEAVVRGAKEPVATEISGTAARIADHLRAVGATGPIQIALRSDSHQRFREPDHIFAPPGLLAAADYVLATVVLPAVHGTRRMVARDGYTCQNPRCRRRTLRVHPHHIHQRQHGGTDDPENIVTLCPACHLRGIHSNQMSVVRIEDWLVWTWPQAGIVIMDSPYVS